MKRTLFAHGWTEIRPTLFVSLAAASVLMLAAATPSNADHHAMSGKGAKTSATSAPPNVALPYTFVCPHCGLKITIKTPADWNKDCSSCACGTTNLGCYHEKK